MSSPLRRALGILLAILFTWGAIQLSAVNYRLPEVDQGLLRLAWRASAQGEQVCRPITAEEIARLPVHMRTEEVCERPPALWELVVSLDGEILVHRTLEGAGARQYTPISIFEEWPLPPGVYDLDVLFRRMDVDEGDPAWRGLTQTIAVEPGRVHLVWIHPETRRMMLSK